VSKMALQMFGTLRVQTKIILKRISSRFDKALIIALTLNAQNVRLGCDWFSSLEMSFQ
jgi:hypothetical protein